MSIELLIFGALAVAALIVAWPMLRRRDAEDIQRMRDAEAADDEMGFGAIDEFEASYDPDAWRGDIHHDDADADADDDDGDWRS